MPRLRPWGFPTVSPSHPSTPSPIMGHDRSRWSSPRTLNITIPPVPIHPPFPGEGCCGGQGGRGDGWEETGRGSRDHGIASTRFRLSRQSLPPQGAYGLQFLDGRVDNGVERRLRWPGILHGLWGAGALSALLRISGWAGCWRSAAVSRTPAFFSRSARACSKDRSRPMAIRVQSGRVGPSSMALFGLLFGEAAALRRCRSGTLAIDTQRLSHGHTGGEAGQEGDAALAGRLDRGLSRDDRHREQRRDQVEHRAAGAQKLGHLLEHAGRRGGQHGTRRLPRRPGQRRTGKGRRYRSLPAG